MAIKLSKQKRLVQAEWTPRLIKRLRGKRTQAEFAALLGTSKNTVWRWESNKSYPAPYFLTRLSDLAKRECFHNDWQLVGSITLLGDLEAAKRELENIFRTSVKRTSRQLLT